MKLGKLIENSFLNDEFKALYKTLLEEGFSRLFMNSNLETL
jgi:hypothetical protein